LIKSKNEHSLHSPFLFDFYTKVVKDKTQYEDYRTVEKLRKYLLQDDSTIEVTDFGAGSRTGANRHRKIRDTAQKASKKPYLAQFIYRTIRFFGYKKIIDLGTSLGLTTAYEALAAFDGQVVSFEGCPQTARIARVNLNELSIDNTEILVGNLDEILLGKIQKTERIDFAFFDANHRYKPTIEYFKICLEKAHEDSCFVFDDIYWSDEMKQAWNEIREHPSVTLSIDFFWIGMVFFRKKQPKQHFILRL
ncbi:MAG: class I SAM-dependent methyltransferase, partial [Spirosomaceae bacterium]|nr:class I SAM-dependent methyltransferase [Spirosomataceae bacterium]